MGLRQDGAAQTIATTGGIIGRLMAVMMVMLGMGCSVGIRAGRSAQGRADEGQQDQDRECLPEHAAGHDRIAIARAYPAHGVLRMPKSKLARADFPGEPVQPITRRSTAIRRISARTRRPSPATRGVRLSDRSPGE